MIEEGRFSEFYKKARETVLKKKKKKPSMDSTTQKLHSWRKNKEKEERKKYVSDFEPIERSDD